MIQAAIASAKRTIERLKERAVLAYAGLIIAILSTPGLYYLATKSLMCE